MWLDECLASCVKQGCDIVCYNDGSPKDPYDIISKYDVRYFGHSKNNGVSFARNRCAEQVTTPLIYPIDCDDKFTADNAIATLTKYYDGVPLYSDIQKFGMGSDSVHVLPKFNCASLTVKLGMSSVNVLHSLEQWKSIGGWDESLMLYEDAEYNGRLMLTYCGEKIPYPLIAYRQHEAQRTRVHINKNALVDTLLTRLKEYSPMAKSCCGGGSRRSNVGVGPKPTQNQVQTSTTPAKSSLSSSMSIPGQNNKLVAAKYIGGLGKGPHYYRGPKTKYAYRVVQGEIIQADRSDTRAETDKPFVSLLVRLTEDIVEEGKKSLVEESVENHVDEIVREPRRNVEDKEPVMPNEDKYNEEDELPDITNMSHRRITQLDLTQAQALKLVDIEKHGKSRVKPIDYLERVAGLR